MTIENRLERLEQRQRARHNARFPPSIGLVILDGFPDDRTRQAAVALEWQIPGTVKVVQIEFIDAENGKPKERIIDSESL